MRLARQRRRRKEHVLHRRVHNVHAVGLVAGVGGGGELGGVGRAVLSGRGGDVEMLAVFVVGMCLVGVAVVAVR